MPGIGPRLAGTIVAALQRRDGAAPPGGETETGPPGTEHGAVETTREAR